MEYYLDIRTATEVWEEEFDPGNRTYHEIIDEVQLFLDNEGYGSEVTIHIHMPEEDHPAVLE